MFLSLFINLSFAKPLIVKHHNDQFIELTQQLHHNKNREWYWLQYDEAIKDYPTSPSTQFLMAATKKNDSIVHFSFPMNKVIKNLAYGNADNVYNF